MSELIVNAGSVVSLSGLSQEPSGGGSGVVYYDTLVNNGEVEVAAGDAVGFGTVVGNGTIALRGGGSVSLYGPVTGGGVISFGPAGGALGVAAPGGFGWKLDNLSQGDTLYFGGASSLTDAFIDDADTVLNFNYNGAGVVMPADCPYFWPKITIGGGGSGGSSLTFAPSLPIGVEKPATLAIGGQLLAINGDFMISPDTRHIAAMQTDGNFVIYHGGQGMTPAPLWASNSYGHPDAYLYFQPDGNLVVYADLASPGENPLWASNTIGRGGVSLVMQNDGNLVMYDAHNNPVWASNTAGR